MKLNFSSIIRKDGECSYVLNAINNAFGGGSLEAISDTAGKSGSEVVIGDTAREITAKAKAELERAIGEKAGELISGGIPEEDITGYLVYSDGESVALVWRDFQIAPKATSYLAENLASIGAKSGVIYSEFFSIMDFLTEHEKTVYDTKWAELEAHIPEEYRADIIRELRLLNSLRTHESAKWLGSLYDPETGGWYVSNSARNTEGFGPDIETTYLALTLVGITGMAEMFDGEDFVEKYMNAYPRDIVEKAGKWIHSLQDEDGYFYLPEWPKEFIERTGNQIRITRDVGSAKTILDALGITPKYSITQKTNGDDKKSTLLTQYESVENFREYLAGWDKELEVIDDKERAWKFYLWGSYFQSTLHLMNDEMKQMMLEFFDRHQNPENGVWSKELYYNSTNAIHKICSVYNRVGGRMKHVDKMIESTLKILNWDVETKPSGNSCEIYNVWSVFPYLYTNIRTCGEGAPEEREARCNENKKLVFAGAAKAINTTYHQIKDMFMPGGEVRCFRHRSASMPHGSPTAPGVLEGDICGFLLGAYDVENNALLALELGDYAPPLFTEKDRVVFMRAVRAAKPPIKRPNPNKQ